MKKLDDLKGMKIRCTGMAAKIVTALGGVPVAMPMGDTYDALSRGVVDGSMAPQESLQGWKWGEVVKYTTESYGSSYSTGMFVVMNKDKWNALPPDIQKIIEKVNEEWIEKQGKAWDEIDKQGRDFTLKSGNKIIPLSKEEDARWAKAVKPILDEYVKNMKREGPARRRSAEVLPRDDQQSCRSTSKPHGEGGPHPFPVIFAIEPEGRGFP